MTRSEASTIVFALIVLPGVMSPAISSAQTGAPVRERISFNRGWEFLRLPEAPEMVGGRPTVPHEEMKVLSSSSEETSGENTSASMSIDGNPATFWHSEWESAKPEYPHELIIDLGNERTLEAFTYLPRQDGSPNGLIDAYELYLSHDGRSWGTPAASGRFTPGLDRQTSEFSRPAKGRFARFIAISGQNGTRFAAVAELQFVLYRQRMKLGSDWNAQFDIMHVDEKSRSGDSAANGGENDLTGEILHVKSSDWQPVILPHTAFVESLIVTSPWEGVCWYRKQFVPPRSAKGRRLSVEFEGAMQVADVWINGRHVLRHYGGYLPFSVDLTDLVSFETPNQILVRLDNRDRPDVPPGKPVRRLDFLYYSGIYRDAWLQVTGPVHITDAVAANAVRGGGIFVTYENVSETLATVNIRTHVKNEDLTQHSFTVQQDLVDSSGRVAKDTLSEVVALEPGEARHIELALHVDHPQLWDPDHPELYTLRTILKEGGEALDQVLTRIGIRSFSADRAEGLNINGKPVRLCGTNRHMAYPWIGNALTDNASYRDLWLIKNAGMNCVRLAHYPQDPSVLEACDELGLLVLDCIPGWQFFNKDQLFTERVFGDIRHMIRRDRNHPSILLWEVSLNEAYPPADFRCKQAEVARSEFIGDNFLTSGDSYFTKACWDVPYDDWNDNPGCRDNTTYADRPFLVREYGDYEFGGTSSTSRQLRGAGEAGMLQQAWNLQWGHEHNRLQYPRCVGDLNWAMYDGLAGCVVGIEAWGPADIFRIPKFAYYFFQSQRDPHIKQPAGIESGPMVYIANTWTRRDSPARIIIYSNCDEVELFVNGKPVGKQKPDSGTDSPYGTELDRGGNPFDRGNCRTLDHPPFTFTGVGYETGELRAVGYIAGRKAAEQSVFTPGKPAILKVEIANGPKPFAADGADAVFVRAHVLDGQGHVVPDATNSVAFTVEGPARVVSPPVVGAEAGIATILLQSTTEPGVITLRAESPGLVPAREQLESRR